MSNLGRYLTTAAVSYVVAAFGSHKYGLITKAQADLRDIKDKKQFLQFTHENIAEKYDSIYQRRDFSNKFERYRRTVLSYATGRTAEFGCGTGANLPHYQKNVKLLMIDWSAGMLMQAMTKQSMLEQKGQLACSDV